MRTGRRQHQPGPSCLIYWLKNTTQIRKRSNGARTGTVRPCGRPSSACAIIRPGDRPAGRSPGRAIVKTYESLAGRSPGRACVCDGMWCALWPPLMIGTAITYIKYGKESLRSYWTQNNREQHSSNILTRMGSWMTSTDGANKCVPVEKITMQQLVVVHLLLQEHRHCKVVSEEVSTLARREVCSTHKIVKQ